MFLFVMNTYVRSVLKSQKINSPERMRTHRTHTRDIYICEASNKAFGSTVSPLFAKAKQGLVFCEGAPALCWKSNICSSKRPLSQESWAATTRKLHIQWPRELE